MLEPVEVWLEVAVEETELVAVVDWLEVAELDTELVAVDVTVLDTDEVTDEVTVVDWVLTSQPGKFLRAWRFTSSLKAWLNT